MVGFAGEPELIDGIAEAYRCTGQIRSEAVRQNPQQLQIALQSFDAVCARISEAACTGACLPAAAQWPPVDAWPSASRCGGVQSLHMVQELVALP